VVILYGMVINAWKVLHILFFFYKEKRYFLRPGRPCVDETSQPLVSVLLPGRNEQGNIGDCIRSVLQSQYRNLELIVIDDRSTDGTAAEIAESIASESRARVLHVREIPAGWTGKMNAVRHGLAVARGDLVLDADTRHRPDTLDLAVAVQQARRTALLSLLPRFEHRTLLSRIVQPLLGAVLFLWKPLMFVNSDRRKWAYIAWGGFLLFKRQALDWIGGIDAIRGCFAADIELARRFKTAGYRIRVYHAPDLISTHLYTSPAEVIAGWSRLIRLTAANRAFLPALTLAVIVGMGLSAYAAIAAGLVELVRGTGRAFPLSLGGMGVIHLLLQIAFLGRMYAVSGSKPRCALGHLPAMLITAYVMLTTLLRRRPQQLTWRDTTYQLTQDGRAAA
jgi:GT2 family glycosyltransferase